VVLEAEVEVIAALETIALARAGKHHREAMNLTVRWILRTAKMHHLPAGPSIVVERMTAHPQGFVYKIGDSHANSCLGP